ncbi:hypothetical protein KGP36_04115 [Patescibacteria group bacterium]|nr:hypothetical protein [Patescibacteria group bacterium]
MQSNEARDPNGLPNWLTAGDAPFPKPSKARSAAEFEMVFPRVLECIAEGFTLSRAVRELPIKVDEGAFYRWIKKDVERERLYKEAKEIRTEVWAGRVIEHAIAEDSTEDVSRSRLIVDSYRWLMECDNRKGYGSVKQIDVTSSISITAALEQGRSRMASLAPVDEIIDAEVVNLLTDGEEE